MKPHTNPIHSLLLALALTAFFTLYLGNTAVPRAFSPTDQTLWAPYKPRATVPIVPVFLVGYALFPPIIYLRTLRSHAPKTALRLALGVLTSSLLAIAATEAGKGSVGVLRPNFRDRCLGPLPGAAAAITSDADCFDGGALARDGRRSFPSGHATLGVGVGAYFCLWGAWVGGTAWYIAGLAVFGAGLAVAGSRVVDGAHHVGDVAVGGMLGVFFAALHFCRVLHEVAKEERVRAKGE